MVFHRDGANWPISGGRGIIGSGQVKANKGNRKGLVRWGLWRGRVPDRKAPLSATPLILTAGGAQWLGVRSVTGYLDPDTLSLSHSFLSTGTEKIWR